MFYVRAKPCKGSFSLSILSEKPLVVSADIPTEPVLGRANALLLSELESLLGVSVLLVAGAKSRRKTLAADCPQEEIVGKLKKAIELAK